MRFFFNLRTYTHNRNENFFPHFRNQKEMAVWKKIRRGNHSISHFFFSGFENEKKYRTCICECVSHMHIHVERKENVESTSTICDLVGKVERKNLKNIHRPQLQATVDDSSPYRSVDDVE